MHRHFKQTRCAGERVHAATCDHCLCGRADLYVCVCSARIRHKRLTVQVDSVAKPLQNDRVIPSNVLDAANFYQTRGLIHGRSRIIPADPSRTTILGNFRLKYEEPPAECCDFSWHAAFFTKGHIEIECDP
jgi:hypothetical protein